MKKCFPQAVRNKRGFSLIEVVFACALLVLVLAVTLPRVEGFQLSVENFRARNLAYTLASDLRRVQTTDMYRGRDFYALNFDELGGRYLVTKAGKVLAVRTVAEYLPSNWRLKAVNKEIVFYMRGSVNVYNYIDIYRPTEVNKGYQVQILPVTGRIGVYKQ